MVVDEEIALGSPLFLTRTLRVKSMFRRHLLLFVMAAFLPIYVCGCGGGNQAGGQGGSGGSGSGSGGGSGSTGSSSSVTSVAASCSPSPVLANQTSVCKATVNGTGNYSNAVTWSVSPSSVGSISSSGTFTPAATGTATIMATSQEDTSQSGSATVKVNPIPAPTTPIIVPSILVAGQQTKATITSFVSGAVSSTQVQLFNLANGSPVLIGDMSDNGQNGDQTAGDHVYTIVTNLTPPAESSLSLQVVATTGTNGTESTKMSVPLVQIPSYTTNTEVNQAESDLYDTAIQTRSSFANPNWSKLQLPSTVSNLASMAGKFAGIVNQNSSLQSSAAITSNTLSNQSHTLRNL